MNEFEMAKRAKKAKRANYIVFTVFVILLAGIAALVIGYKVRHNFTPAKWEKYPDKRTAIVDDLLSDYDLIGKTHEEIRYLLGEESYPRFGVTENDMVYCLGPERGFISIDDEWLVILFTGDTVSHYYIPTD